MAVKKPWTRHSNNSNTATAPPQPATASASSGGVSASSDASCNVGSCQTPDTATHAYPPKSETPAPAAKTLNGGGRASDLAWVPKYIEELIVNGGQKGKAATSAGTSRQRVAEHRLRDTEFKKLEEVAMEGAREVAEDEARRRAVDGMVNIYTTKDGATREVKTYSDTLLLRLLERMETGTWRQKHQVEHSGKMEFKTMAERKEALKSARTLLKLPNRAEDVTRN